jgi:hypothetical protein
LYLRVLFRLFLDSRVVVSLQYRTNVIILSMLFHSLKDVELVFFLIKQAFVTFLGDLESHHFSIVFVVIILLHGLPARHPHEQFADVLLVT